MNADEFRDYILGFLFYKYLSEKIERFANLVLEEYGLQFAELKENSFCSQHIAAYPSNVLSFRAPYKLFYEGNVSLYQPLAVEF